MVSVNLSDIYIFSIQGVEYHCPIDGISKIEAINILQDTDLCEKSWTLQNIHFNSLQ